MQKNLPRVATAILLMGLHASTNYAANFSGIKTAIVIGGIGTIVAAGNKAGEMNEEYSKKKKRPDFNMRVTKAAGTAVVLVGTDLLLGQGSLTENLAKLGAFSFSLFAITDVAADIVRPIPIIGGLLTDPVNENGEEMKDSGAYARGLLVYIPLRDIALSVAAFTSEKISTE